MIPEQVLLSRVPGQPPLSRWMAQTDKKFMLLARAKSSIVCASLRCVTPFCTRWLRRGRCDVDLGDVPPGHADHGGSPLQVSRVPGDGQRLRLAGEQRDVVVLPDRGLQFVVAGQFLAARGAAPQMDQWDIDWVSPLLRGPSTA